MIGADIEYFLRNLETGKIVPACGLVGGTKQEPIKYNDTYSLLEDGAAVELNYLPTNDAKTWVQRISGGKDVIRNHLKAAYDVTCLGEVSFENIKHFPQAMEIGCLPDFDAYAKNPEKSRKIPNIKKFGNMRFAGAHLHFSYTTKDKIPAWVVAKLIDLFVLCPVLGNTQNLDTAAEMLGETRRRFYGLPGLHRPKEYGVEYRTFANPVFALSYHLRDQVGYIHTLLNDEKYVPQLEQIYMNTNWQELKDGVERLDLPKLRGLYDGARRQLTGL